MNASLRRLWPCLIALLFVALPCLAHAATLNVPSASYPTIQSGVNASQNGDTVLVADGTYSGPGNRDIDFNGKNITVTSQNGPAKTIIDCGGYKSTDRSGNHRGFYIHSGETKATISGFTVKNGYENGSDGNSFSLINAEGGGIYIAYSNATIQDCTISGNTTLSEGGGVFNNHGGTITLTNCTVSGNTAQQGGGVENFENGTTTFTNCTVTGNDGGGIVNYNSSNGTITLTNCTATANTGHFGSGVYNDNPGASGMITLTNCTVSGNSAQQTGGGVYNVNVNSNGVIILANCTVSGNTAHNGGGVYNENYNNSGSTTLANCTVSGNTVDGSGGGIYNYNDGGNITLTSCTVSSNTANYGGGTGNTNYNGGNSNGKITLNNCIFYQDRGGEIANYLNDPFVPNGYSNAIATYSDIQGGYAGTGNINADPLLVNAATGDLHIKPGSPCLGAGTPNGASATDKDGRTRPNPPTMGAYELAATLTLSPQYPTIQSAITAVRSGDTIMVPSGTYTGPGNVDWDFGGKNITVSSVNGAASAIIDCGGYDSADGSGNHRGFYLHSGETNAVISGFTIKNGYESAVPGVPDSGYGGNLCVDGSSVSIKKCVFVGGTATVAGGGVAIIGKGHHSMTFTNCVFTKNTALKGGAVYTNNDTGTVAINNCTTTGNTAQQGGGLFNQNSAGNGSIGLTGCSVSGNTAQTGGGIYNENDLGGDTITLINCSVSGNASPLDGGIYNFNATSDDTISLINDIVYHDSGGEVGNNPLTASATSISYSDIQGGSLGTSNIDQDPLFVNAAAGDLHLKPGSPCLGRGTPDGAPTTDLDGNQRPNPPSMGAYELVASLARTSGITAVSMVSSHELDVDIATQAIQPIERFVSLDMTINGQPVHVSQKVYFGNPLDNPHSFIIDLKKAGVPRFKDNQRFTITESYEDNGNVEDNRDGVILLPVVLVPGIGALSGTTIGELLNDDHPGGGQGTFPEFETYLTSQSLSLVKTIYGDGYSTAGPYQTLYTLTYVRNIASFSDGAQALANQITNIVAESSVETYADRVNIVTHSKGGLVTRQYLTNLGDKARDVVKQVILTVPPNLGSPLAVAGRIVLLNQYDYRNLTPTYPWFRPVQRLSSYFKLPPNPELDSLNRQRLPSGIDYALIYSRAFHYRLGYTTPETFTAATLFSSHFTFDEGDGVVPWFSQLGLQFDPNNPKKTPVLIPAFVDGNGQPIITDEKEVTSFHSTMLDNPDAQSYIFDRLTGDIK